MKRIILCLALACLTLEQAQSTPIAVTANQENEIKQERAVADFTGIASGGNFNVYVSIGEKESLRLEGKEELLNDIETKIEKGVLKIQYKAKKRMWDWNRSDRDRINIYITAKVLSNLVLSGSGKMVVNGTLKAPNFISVVSGSGNLTLNTETINFNGVISGSGSINLSGSSQTTDLSISGSGSLRAKDFKTKSANVSISGSGNSEIHVEQSLNGSISGLGSIRYGGNPSIVIQKSGSGSISKL